MGLVQSKLKEVVVLRGVGKNDFPSTFADAIQDGIIAATPDAEAILLALDQESGNFHPANDDGEKRERRYDLRVVHQRIPVSYLIDFGRHLLRKGWPLFLNHEALLAFVCREFEYVLPPSCESISIPVRVGGKVKAMIVSPWKDANNPQKGARTLVDIHPMAYTDYHSEYVLEWLSAWPLEKGEKILLLH